VTAIALGQDQYSVPDALRRHWRAWAVLAAMAVLWAAAAFSVVLQSVAPGPELDAAPGSPELARLRATATQTSATALRQVAPQTALALNAAMPIAQGVNPAAAPFTLLGGTADRARSLDCLTAAIYYESAREPTDGQRAVAQVILNRVRHPAYPATVCGVVFEGARRSTGCQFSFTCDGSLRHGPMPEYWERSRAVAAAALNGYVYAPVGWATHYHANYVMPYWAPTLVKSANVGLHIFYRWRGGWGRPAAFVNRYSGAEPAIAWRGGFGQSPRSEVQLAVSARDAMAAQAAAAAAVTGTGSVDSFQRAVLRRYEPLQRESAGAMITERTRSDSTLTASQRWALTGADTGPAAQAPLGRRREGAAEPPRELQGVRYRWDPTPPTSAPAPSGGEAASSGAEASATEAR
jgi:spore germination cell wall hydrolase CwlJ-like protein